MYDRFTPVGANIPEIMLPALGTDLSRWAVVACDQFTSQPEYWDEADAFVGGAPSTLRMIWPEAWLGRPGADAIPGTMEKYLANGVFAAPERMMVLVERETASGVRRGLVLALDLEQYDYTPGSQRLIRATEGTVMDRLPPRIAVRERAPLELPHAMALIDDPGDTVMGPLSAARLPILYDFELMLDGGRLSGRRVDNPALLDGVASALEALRDRGQGFLFAVGDGNHSLAAAREYWIRMSSGLSPAQRETHPARWALVEVVNLHDPALRFEPIHRALFHVDPEEALAALCHELRQAGKAQLDKPFENAWEIAYVHGGGRGVLYMKTGDSLAVEALQRALDGLAEKMPGMNLDYIHGSDVAERLGAGPGCLGLILPPFDKAGLFPAVRRGGVLPRKSFSMGQAVEKRYYMECRRIR